MYFRESDWGHAENEGWGRGEVWEAAQHIYSKASEATAGGSRFCAEGNGKPWGGTGKGWRVKDASGSVCVFLFFF